MSDFGIQLTRILAVSTLLGQVVLVLAIAYLVARRAGLKAVASIDRILMLAREHAIELAFLVAVTGTGLSLLYSEGIGLAPCELCWWQRAFLYPQTIIYAIALALRHKGVAAYGFALASLGLLVGAYQYLLQMMAVAGASTEGLSSCGDGGLLPSCTSYYFLELGYITMPLMSVTASAFILLFLGLRLWGKKA